MQQSVEEDSVEPIRRRKPSPARAARYLQERDELVSAAFRLLDQRGDIVGVHEILREAGQSTRAFYRHFPTKDHLLLFMYRESSERVAHRLAAAVASAQTADEALEAWVAEYLSVGYQPRRLARARVLANLRVSAAAGYAEVHTAEAAQRRSEIEEVLQRGLKDGSIPFAQPRQDAYAVFALVSSYLADRVIGAGTFTFEEALNHTVQLFLRPHAAPRPRR